MKSPLLLVALLLSGMAPAVTAATNDCDALAAQVEQEQAVVRPVQGMRVAGPARRLFFHDAPDPTCVSKTFVVPNDQLIAYDAWKDWFCVQYTNPKSGKIFSGWVKGDGVEVTGTMGMDSSPGPELPPEVPILVVRYSNCVHFSGEINGDQSEHDREVSKTMDELGCDTVDAEVETVRKKYADRPAVAKALDEAAE